MLRYYEETTARRNLCAVALCVPLLGFVTTCAVKAGEELFATYGHTYWLQEDLPCSDAVEEALKAPSMEVCMWQIATDKKHGKAIVALDQFLMDHSEDNYDMDNAAQKLDTLDLTDGSSRADATKDTKGTQAAKADTATTTTTTTKTATTTTTTTTTAEDGATVVSEPPQGFGQATRKPKGGGKPKRR